MAWTPDRLPSLAGKAFLVTGGNSGLGEEATRILASKGARVLFTSRRDDKADAALERIRRSVPDADVSYVLLDLTDPASIDACAAAVHERVDRLDAIINNAGVMQPPETRTAEGFELQMATNHLGHFRLNRALFDLVDAAAGRIVPVSSIAHKMGRIDLDDLQSERGYDPTVAYAQSKLANLMYGLELQRRLSARGSRVSAISSHPGYAATNLQSAGVGMDGGSKLFRGLYKVTNALVAQPAERGAWPLVLAAADPDAEPGGYYGPTGIGDARGPVGKAKVSKNARDAQVAAALWDKTEALVGPFFG